MFSFRSLPLEGAAERREAGLASFLGRSRLLFAFPIGEGFVRQYCFSPHMRVFALTMREKRYSRFVAFPIGEGGPRQRRSGALVNGALETIFPALFHTASTLSGSLCSPPSPRGEGC